MSTVPKSAEPAETLEYFAGYIAEGAFDKALAW